MSLLSIGSSPSAMSNCPAHSHDSWEVVLNISGSGETLVGQVRHRFSPGSILCIPPQVAHAKYSENGFEDIYFHTNAFPLSRELKSGSVLALCDDAEKSMETIMRLMQRIYFKNGENSKAVAISLYRAAIDLLAGWLEKKPAGAVAEQIQDKLIAAFTDPETDIENILAGSGYSPDHTRRRFKEFFGVTPGEYLTDLRIGYAKQLMEQNQLLQLPITEISLMCGYYDSHYFSRIFKGRTGMSPRAYLNAVSADTQTP